MTLPDSGTSLPIATVEDASPFAHLKARWLLVVVTIAAAITGISTGLLVKQMGTRAPDERLLAFASYAGALVAMVLAGRHVRLDWRRLMGPGPTRAEAPLALVIVPVGLLTFASAFMVYVPLSYVVPAFVERKILAPDGITNVTSLGQWFLLMLVGVIAAPVVEEVLFRGLLLHRWAHRWGTTSGVVASSLLFAMLHQEWVGHFLFGVALSALYLRTRSLWLPIAAHAINNGAALIGTLPNALSHHAEPVETLAEFRAQSWAIVPLLLAGLVTGWLYLRRFFPGGVMAAVRGRTPYESQESGIRN